MILCVKTKLRLRAYIVTASERMMRSRSKGNFTLYDGCE